MLRHTNLTDAERAAEYCLPDGAGILTISPSLFEFDGLVGVVALEALEALDALDELAFVFVFVDAAADPEFK